jgi:uncharacterized protein YjiS (DUF1127 family)
MGITGGAATLPRRVGTIHTAALKAIRRIVAATQLRRARARWRPQLRELSDHMLQDIGRRREDVGCEFARLFWHRG